MGLNAVRFRQVLRFWSVLLTSIAVTRENGKQTVRGFGRLCIYGRTGGGSAGPVKELEKFPLGKARKWQERNQGTTSHVPRSSPPLRRIQDHA